VAAEARTAHRGLWGNPDFLKLWGAQAVSAVGSTMTREALPLVAQLTLLASPFEIGVLAAAGAAPVLIVGLPAGVWVDRLRRKPILMAADLGRAALLVTVPLAAWAGVLTIWQLYVVAALAGALTVWFDVADQSFLPTVVREEELIEGNSKLGVTGSVAEIASPALGGLLVQTLSAPFVLLLDAISFLVSAFSLGLIRKSEQPPERDAGEARMMGQIGVGLRLITGSPILRALAVTSATFSFFGGFFMALYGLYVIRDLDLSPFVLGVLVGAGGVGALAGAFLAGRVAKRFGIGPSIVGAMILLGLLQLPVPLVAGPDAWVITVMMTGQLLGDAAIAIYFINELSLRQSMIPGNLLGRASASVQFIVGGVLPLGALLGGLLGELIGIRATLLVSILGTISGGVLLLLSPVRRVKNLGAGNLLNVGEGKG
jgi:MFS family permease